jgi:pimeloyl-ACP methyl ester carboxylesterase
LVTVPPPDHLVTGTGSPSTVFVAGLAQTLADVRVFASGVSGTRTFVELVVPSVSAGLDDLDAVCAEVVASQALGVSLGATTVLALAARQPQQFDRLVLALPGAVFSDHLEPARGRMRAVQDAFEQRDQIAMAQALLAVQPESVRGRLQVTMWARRQADVVLGLPLGPLLDDVLSGAAAGLVSALDCAAVTVPVLVLAQRDDDVHPVTAAEQLAGALPDARLVVSDVPWVWSARDRLREVVSGFLAGG